MSKKLIVTLLLLCNLNFYAQINFEKAYFIDNNNNKTECLIKNYDWKNNPVKIEFKNDENSEVNFKTINDIKEFSVGNNHKYVRAEVKIDTSSSNIQSYSTSTEPNWALKKLFLKIIIEGEFSLYEFVDGDMSRFFYKNKDGDIAQLVYKKYIFEDSEIEGENIKENKTFQRQLFANAKCQDVTFKELMKLKYNTRDLTNYFMKINNCDGNKNVVNYTDEKSQNLINFKIKGGINFVDFSRYQIPKTSTSTSFDFENKKTYRIGAEIEYILPFNKNKWSAFFEPTFSTKYKSDKTITTYYNALTYSTSTSANYFVDYTYLDLTFGVRYYIFLNQNAKIFLTGNYIFSPVLKTKSSYDFVSRSHLAYGLGYNYKNKASVELRYSNSDVLADYVYWKSSFQNISIVLGYTIFDKNNNKK